MKAIRIHSYGPADNLSYDEVPDPVPAENEVIVEVEATGVNPADYKFRNGLLARAVKKPMPLTLGMDVAGRIVAVGEQVSNGLIGKRVLAMLYMMGNGGYAERVAVPADWCAPMPEGMDAVVAASLPTPATTAVEWIEDDLALASGQRVLVTGASGAVGVIACYVAKQRGAHVTAAVRQQYRDRVRYADDTIVLGDDIESLIGRFDCIADSIGGEVGGSLLPLLKKGGVLSSISTDRVTNPEGLDVVIRIFGNKPDAPRLARLAQAVSTGDLVVPPAKTMRLSEAAQAHRALEAGGSGKIVLVPDRLYAG